MEKINIKKPTIFLAGDSTVKTYDSNWFISGWGQFLDLFLSDQIVVANASQGGRSSRMFINEGRLFNINNEHFNYTFPENNGKSLEDSIKKGDFLFIQFGHNDDETYLVNGYQTMYNRMVPLGQPDELGIFPTRLGNKVSTKTLPEYYLAHATKEEIDFALNDIPKYGTEYYSYDCGGTYKGYLKLFIDLARKKGAIPVLVTPVARIKFENGKIVGDNGCHGKNLEYVNAVRQLAIEEDCLFIDLFKEAALIYEAATPSYAKYLMSIVPKESGGLWPDAYDELYGNYDKGFIRGESTHFNKFGAYLLAGKVIENILDNNNITKYNESFNFKEFIEKEPKEFIVPSNLIGKEEVGNIKKLFKNKI